MNDTAQPKARTPRFCHGPTELVPLIWDLVSGLHQGQRAYRPHQKAVHMTAAAKSLVTKVLAKGPSTYDKKILSKFWSPLRSTARCDQDNPSRYSAATKSNSTPHCRAYFASCRRPLPRSVPGTRAPPASTDRDDRPRT